MKTITIFFGFFLVDVFVFLEVEANYHDAVGIPAAKKIKELEEAMQADGTINIESRIIGGERAPHPYPFFAGLIISLIGKPTMDSFCGSSLLSSNRVVTAAHCYFDGVDRASKFEVVLGSNLLYQGGDRHVTRHVQVHPYYDPKFFTNDVAILYLPQNVRFTNLVHPIRLPTNYEQTNTFAGYMAVAVGFGNTTSKQPLAATVLSHVELQVIDNAQCAASYNINFVTPNTICTSGIGIAGSVGVCNGDSGGPLFIYDSNRHPVLIGITSFGRIDLPCESGAPQSYSRVTRFMNFIKQHLY